MSNVILEEISTSLGLNRRDVDLESSFVALGGHSLSAAGLAAACRKRGLDVPVASILTEPSILSLLHASVSKINSASSISTASTTSDGRPSNGVPHSDEEYATRSDPASPTTSKPMLWPIDEPPDEPEIIVEHSYRSSEPNMNKFQYNSDILAEISTFLSHNPRVHPHSQADIREIAKAVRGNQTRLPVRSSSPSTVLKETGNINPSQDHNMRDANWMTEMQLSLLQGSLNDPRTNFIYHSSTYTPEIIPQMKRAWSQIILTEPIFQIQEYYTGPDGTGNYIRLRDQSQRNIKLNWKQVEAGTEASYLEAKTNCEELFDLRPDLELNHLDLEIQFRVITWNGFKRCGKRNESTLIWRVHHALIDGFSASLVFQKLRAAKTGVVLPPGRSFRDLAVELRKFQVTQREAGNAYWAQKQTSLVSATRSLLLPAPRNEDTGEATQRCAELTTTLSTLPIEVLSSAQQMNVTPAAIFYAAWALVLSTYTDSDATVVGAILSGRHLDLPNVESVIGPLINTLPFLIQLNRKETNRSLIQRTFAQLVELATFQWTTPANGYTRDFASALAVQFELPGSKDEDMDLLELSNSKVETDIPLSVMVEGAGIIRIVYRVATYSSFDIERLAKSLSNAVAALLRPDATVQCSLDSMLSYEDQKVLHAYGNSHSGLTTRAAVKDDLVTIFERQVLETPDGIAVEKGDARITYRELDMLAGFIATVLPVSPKQVVCLEADKSINWIAGMWAILKIGGVYCAIDPNLPTELRDQVYVSAGASLFLAPTTEALSAKPPSAMTTFDIERFVAELKTKEPLVHRKIPQQSRLAYLCFTSGSTGKPKGVMCSHEGLVAFQRDLEVRLFAQPGRRISQFMSVAFDGSIHEIFSALCYGATLVLSCGGDPFEHLRKVDSAILVPSVAAVLNPADFPMLKTVYFVGERVPQSVADQWGQSVSLYNMYGPTEGTGGATITRLLPNRPVTIGGPNPSSRIYILNSHQSQVAPGVIGEIYLAGVQIARGYIGRPDETAARFLPDSVNTGLEEQMYRTGDRGYWNRDGDIVFLGRNDRQIKLRGFRLDLEDIEVRMLKACVRAGVLVEAVAVAVTRDSNETGNKNGITNGNGDSLVALIRPATIDVAQCRKAISASLPVQAIPRYIITVGEFPVTKVGKLDYAAIARYDHATMAANRGIAVGGAGEQVNVNPTAARLQGRTERQLETTWRKVLGLSPSTTNAHPTTDYTIIDAKSSFTALGGHSLAQLRLGNQLTSLFHTKVPLRLIVECDNLREMAAAIDQLKERDVECPQRAEVERRLGDHDLSPIELDWWQKYDLDASSSAFNVSMAGIFTPATVNRGRLIVAWNTVLATHRLLRCRYVCHKRKVTRIYAPNAPQVQSVHGTIDIWAEVNRPFQLTQGPPVRVLITSSQMVLTISHIVCDLTTLNILLDQVSSLYRGDSIPATEQTYMDSTSWYKTAAPCYLDHWETTFPDARLQNPSRLSSKPRSRYGGRSLIFSVKQSTWHRMQTFATARNVTYQQLALAAVALALAPADDDIDMTLGLPYINRNSEADIKTVGLYLEPLPVRIVCSNADAPATHSYLDIVQQASRAALGFAVPWQQLLDHLQIVPDYPNHPLFETMVTFHDSSNAPAIAIPGIEPCVLWTEGSKFQLMCEFTALSADRLLLRLEFDSECFSDAEIVRVENCVGEALEMLVAEQAYKEIRERLKTFAQGGLDICFERLEQDIFAKPIAILG